MSESINVNDFLNRYPDFKETRLSGRYISHPEIEPLLKDLCSLCKVEEVGLSFLDVPIESIQLGTGPLKIFGWSQMHGNESTTTKGLFDLLNLFTRHSKEKGVKELLEKCSFLFLPMLNPDGAARYTRENVNNIDLNRDANDRHEPESKVLRKVFEDFQPHYCLNLHDQRTIFSAGKHKNPATLSFLAPAMDEQKSVPEHRLKAMQLICAMNKELQQVIPGQVGRYGDDFNINCTGDTFQSLQVPTILFEAGHFPNDYLREETRKYFAFALFVALTAIVEDNASGFTKEDYEEIPENRKGFYDVILRNAKIDGEVEDVAIQFREKMLSGQIHFVPVVQLRQPNISCYGHREIECDAGEVRPVEGKSLNENDIVESILLKNEKLSIKSQDIP